MPAANPATMKPAGADQASGKAALCFVIDGESTLRHFVSLILQGSGIDTMEFMDGAGLRKAAHVERHPDMVFLDVNLDIEDAMQTIEWLAGISYTGAVQLMSNRGSAVLESVKSRGTQHKLNMLPVLKKPFETTAIQKIIAEHKLGQPPPATVRIALSEALKNNWIEFWFQPKVDLRRKQLAGVEAFARVQHPRHGILMPGSFLPGADDASLLALAEHSLASALKAGIALSKLGVELPIAVNVPLSALVKLPVGDIVRTYRSDTNNWAGLMIDLNEDQIVTEIPLANRLREKLEPHNVKITIDNFGRGHASLMRLKELPFAEMKLDRSFVVDCGTNKVNAPICKSVIDLAHGFNSVVVGIGLEKAADVLALVSMGCDLGQGFLFGEPLPQERFVTLLRQRATVRAPTATAPKKKPALTPA
jgi:EAL domain-containing protein (putative c-di-GMP-specific phosphodiesterase class I)/CheY-like chemotaxis protein